MARGRPKKKITLEDLPPVFSKALIKIMANMNIGNTETGLEFAAFLLDAKSNAFEKAVNSEAERRYRARHFTEMNKTMKTRDRKEYHQGYNSAKVRYCITYPCTVCGKPVEIMSNHREIIKIIRESLQIWGHTKCINKK